MKSLLRAGEMWQFRKPNEGESESSYRQSLANFVAPKDFIESEEIRNSKGWDKWSDEENKAMLLRSAFTKRTAR